jgi:hypothetical protein
MIHNRVNWRTTTRRLVLPMIPAVLAFASLHGPAVHAQSLMRSPNINFGSRVPTINSSVAPLINSNIAARAVITVNRTTAVGRNTGRVGATSLRSAPWIGTRSRRPKVRYYSNPYPACGDAYRGGECGDQPLTSLDGGGGGAPTGKHKRNGPRRNTSQATALGPSAIAREIVAEVDGSLSDPQADALARRHGLARLQRQSLPLIGATIELFRITDRRPMEIVSRELAADPGVRSVQPNFRYALQDQTAALSEGDPAQYALLKLRLSEAHTLAHGTNVTIAIIDSGVDARHPELANAVAESFDALGSKEGSHPHGTGVAGAIVAHAHLMGSAPAARILAIRAFGNAAAGAQSTSFVVLKALDYAAAHHAQIVNMSFAGPKDALVERGIAASAAKGMVMVAAGGNAGPKSPPLYPAANTNVIAVSATDSHDKLFSASNRGGHIALAAPGVDILLPAPDGKYQITTGTSFAAAYISGLAALLLERNPALKPEEVRATLMTTARDLGPAGRDDLFGAGVADAYAAVSAVVAVPAVPVIAASDAATVEKASEIQDRPATTEVDATTPR